jgi:hypothetical protein
LTTHSSVTPFSRGGLGEAAGQCRVAYANRHDRRPAQLLAQQSGRGSRQTWDAARLRQPNHFLHRARAGVSSHYHQPASAPLQAAPHAIDSHDQAAGPLPQAQQPEKTGHA